MFRRKGQSTLEYALIIAVVVAGLLVMQHYIKRGYAGRLKSASDELGQQYDPASYTANFTVNSHSRANQIVKDRETTINQLDNQYSRKTGSETVNAWTEGEKLFNTDTVEKK